MKTNGRHMYTRLLAVSLLGLLGLSGCVDVDSGGGEPERSVLNPADENLVCPTGRIPWRFAATTPTNSEEYAEGSSSGGAAALPDYSEIEIQSVSCADGALYSEETLERLQDRCDGQRSCDVTRLCQSSACASGATAPGCAYSDATVAFTCGSKTGGTSGTQTSSAESAGTFLTSNRLSCRGVNEDLSQASDNAGRVACVPAECHGRTRRNADMECVADASKIEVVVTAELGEIKPAIETMDSLSKAIMARDLAAAQSQNQVIESVPMPLEGTYDIPVTVRFANDLVPDEVKFTAWIEDKNDVASAFGLNPYYFRCVAFGFTIEKDDPSTFSPAFGIRTYQKTIRTKFSETCDPAQVRRHYKQLIDEAGGNGSLPPDSDLTQQIHLSYDMEGRTVWHKGLGIFAGSELGDSEPECAPNPVDMFYEAQQKAHNRSAYYKQRLISTYKPPNATRITLTNQYSDRAEIGTVDIVARNTPKLRVYSSRKSNIQVDLSWYLSNLNDTNLLNFEVAKTTRDVGRGEAAYLHSMRADVFVVPVVTSKRERESYTPLLLGSTPLTDGTVDGEFDGAADMVTQSVAVPIEAAAKQELVGDTASPYYIEGKSRAFDLFYCINATDGLLRRDAYVPVWGKGSYWYRNELRWLTEPLPGRNGGSAYSAFASYDLAVDAWMVAQGETPPAAHTDGPFKRVWSVELENPAMHAPDSVPFKYRGCRTARQPVVIDVDRFKPAITPVERVTSDVAPSARTHTDFSDEKKSGDERMSGTQDNGSQETCPNNDSSDVYCSNTSNSGGRSSGEGGRPALDMTATIERTPPADGAPYPTAAIKFRGQMASFSALDMSKLGGVFGAGNTGQSRTLSFSIEPDWDNIASLLNGGDPSPNTEWDSGRFGERDGLGYSIGYNLMFNIGPVPVFVTIKFTVGAAIGLTVELVFAPEPGEEYGCLGESEDCVVVTAEAETFDEASSECVSAGGTLSEMRTSGESTKLLGALSDEDVTGASWIGGQLAYETITRDTEFRWLSDDTTFGASRGGGAVTTFDNVEAPGRVGLRPLAGTPGGVSYDPSLRLLGSAPITTALPYACTLPPADREVYFEWSTALELTLAAGVGLEGCTPSPFVGFCLGASLNIVAATIGAKIGQSFRWLFDEGASKPKARHGALTFSVPFGINLFSGDVTAALRITLKFFTLSLGWTIHEFDGISLVDINLYELTLPTLEDY